LLLVTCHGNRKAIANSSQPNRQTLKKQNKISFVKYMIIGIPVFVGLGLVALALNRFGIDDRVSLVGAASVFVAAFLTEYLVRKIYKNN